MPEVQDIGPVSEPYAGFVVRRYCAGAKAGQPLPVRLAEQLIPASSDEAQGPSWFELQPTVPFRTPGIEEPPDPNRQRMLDQVGHRLRKFARDECITPEKQEKGRHLRDRYRAKTV